tara:strand:+ start:242 stop:526 length:285 start_codon:yes stop_codon:yes gene_type:complete
MPYYDYKCKECDHTWEEQQSIDSRNVPRYNPCPSCGTSDNIILVMGTPSFNDPLALGISKPPAHVQDRLKQIKKAHPNAGASLKGSKFGENLSY